MTIAECFNPGGPFFLIAGPCVLEGPGLNQTIAAELRKIQRQFEVPVVIFKASFDKANRTSGTSSRGPGLEQGLRLLAQVKDTTGLPVLTDVHEPAQAAPAGAVCDVLQVPAFLCRQTDLLTAVARTGKPINLKKGQWVGVPEMRGAVEKIADIRGRGNVAVTERGTFFGYGDLVVDFRNVARLKTLGVPVIFDGTHSLQRPAAAGQRSGGDPALVPMMVRAAVVAGVDGIFLEVHPQPASAPSDGDSMFPLAQLAPLMEDVMHLREQYVRYGMGRWSTA